MEPKELLETVQSLAKVLSSSAVVKMDEENAVCIYTDAGWEYNDTLKAAQAKEKRRKERPVKPLWKCWIQGSEIVSSLSMPGVTGTIDELHGLVQLAFARHIQNSIIWASGGILGLQEANNDYNDTNRMIITGMQLIYEKPLLGYINIYERQSAVVAGEESLFLDVPVGQLYNDCADFILPPITAETRPAYDELAGLLRLWNASAEEKELLLAADLKWYANQASDSRFGLVKDINSRIEALGGILLIWR